MVELLLGVGFDTCLPVLDLLILELAEALADRGVELIDVLVLFTILDGLAQQAEPVHGLLYALVQPVRPGKRACNGWEVA